MMSLEALFHEGCRAAITVCGVFTPLCFNPTNPVTAIYWRLP